MDVADLKLARKLLALFSAQDYRQRAFDRYWPLAGPVNVFLECAEGEREQALAKALLVALEEVLRDAAPRDVSDQAAAVSVTLGVEPWRMRPHRPRCRRRP